MIKVLTIDDEPKNLRIMSELLSVYCREVNHVGEADNIETAIQLISELQPDLVLLDIEMPHGNAFDLLDMLMPVNFEIVFVTAFDEYALRAFRYSAMDYLLKPVSIEELQQAIDKANERASAKELNKRLSSFVENRSEHKEEAKKIAVPLLTKGYEFIRMGDILYCEAKGGYTYLFTKDNKHFISSTTLKKYEETFSDKLFLRVHNSCLVNLKKVTKYIAGRGGVLIMENGEEIEVAVRRKDELLSRLNLK